MLSAQVKFSIAAMIEGDFGPQLYRVTTIAFIAILAIMLIVILMAVNTKGTEFFIKAGLLVAGITGKIAMPKPQRKISIFIVIEA